MTRFRSILTMPWLGHRYGVRAVVSLPYLALWVWLGWWPLIVLEAFFLGWHVRAWGEARGLEGTALQRQRAGERLPV